jgi:hypothetical protein
MPAQPLLAAPKRVLGFLNPLPKEPISEPEPPMSIAGELKKKASELAALRVSNFDPYIDGAFQCPRCWIEDGRKLRIVTVSSKALGKLNTYHCFACNYEVTG